MMKPPPAPQRAVTIPRRTAKSATAVDFQVLRAEGIRHVQDLAGGRWTDYNLHDPGVTILEQLCYALTELAYRADFPVADHLCGEDGSIDYDAQALFKPEDILPCRALTAADYRAALLAEVPELADAALEPHPTKPGLLRLRLRLRERVRPQTPETSEKPGAPETPETPETAEATVQKARAAWRRWRTLGEDIDEEVVLVGERRCALHAEIEVSGARDPAAVLAEVYHRCAQFITGAVPLRSVEEMLLAGVPLEQAYDGPPVAWRVDAARAAVQAEARRTRLVVGDLAALIRTVPGVHDVRHVKLQVEQDPPNARSVEWQGPRWELSLRVPGYGADLSQVHLTRRGSALRIDEDAVASEYDDLRARSRSAVQVAMEGQRVADLPRGNHRPASPYLSVAHQFPPVYGLGPQGLAPADRAAAARTTQLVSYLALFEQTLAHGQTHLAHLRELFAPAHAQQPSYWWQMLGDAEVPGIESLYRLPVLDLQAQAFERFDNASGRRQRALDQMLALYGQTYAQNTMRQFLTHLDSAEAERVLLRNKAQFLNNTVRLSRDRASGFDYADEAWLIGSNCSGLQRSVRALLGFGLGPNQRLCPPRAGEPGGLIDGVDVVEGSPPDEAAPRRIERLVGRALTDLQPLARPVAGLADRITPRRRRVLGLGAELPGALLRAGVEWTRYRWRPLESGPKGQLLLGPDESTAWWELGPPMSEVAAARTAHALRRWLLKLNRESEGLHLVEHTLLRPRTVGGPVQRLRLADDFFALRVSVVFPKWTVRTAQPSFQRFAAESVQMSLPAHVVARCVWLDLAAMRRFETLYPEWLTALRRYATAPAAHTKQAAAQATDAARALDEAAAALIPLLSATPGEDV